MNNSGSNTNPRTCVLCGAPLTATYIQSAPEGWSMATWRCPVCDTKAGTSVAVAPCSRCAELSAKVDALKALIDARDTSYLARGQRDAEELAATIRDRDALKAALVETRNALLKLAAQVLEGDAA